MHVHRFGNRSRIVLALRSRNSGADEGGRRNGEASLVWKSPAVRPTRWAYGGRRSSDQIRNCFRGDESAAANGNACQLPGPQQVIDGIARDAAQELSGFLDRVQGTVLHGSLVALERSEAVEIIGRSAQF